MDQLGACLPVPSVRAVKAYEPVQGSALSGPRAGSGPQNLSSSELLLNRIDLGQKMRIFCDCGGPKHSVVSQCFLCSKNGPSRERNLKRNLARRANRLSTSEPVGREKGKEEKIERDHSFQASCVSNAHHFSNFSLSLALHICYN